MFYIILSFLILTIPTLGLLYARHDSLSTWQRRCNEVERRNATYKSLQPDPLPEKPQFNNILFIAAPVVFVIYTLSESFTVVPAGHIGIQVTFGTVNQQTLTEGAHFVNPLSYIREVDVRLVTTKLGNASAGTKDLQQVHTDIVVNYRLDGAKVGHIYKEFGLNLEDKVILPGINESFKAVVARYTSEDLIVKRDVVSQQIREELATKLAKYNVGVNDISLVNFAFSADYQKAIEAKVIATQSKLKAEQDLARIEVEAKQAVARAEGRAKAIQIETQAINSQGGAAYVQLKAIERWDGKLPATMANGSVPFVNLK
jgi:regulator of protease activity HflC (stomatin/prohibitin superfamily)